MRIAQGPFKLSATIFHGCVTSRDTSTTNGARPTAAAFRLKGAAVKVTRPLSERLAIHWYLRNFVHDEPRHIHPADHMLRRADPQSPPPARGGTGACTQRDDARAPVRSATVRSAASHSRSARAS